MTSNSQYPTQVQEEGTLEDSGPFEQATLGRSKKTSSWTSLYAPAIALSSFSFPLSYCYFSHLPGIQVPQSPYLLLAFIFHSPFRWFFVLNIILAFNTWPRFRAPHVPK